VIAGPVASPEVDLTATNGSIEETGNGVVIANTLTGSAALADLTGNNSVTTLGAFTTPDAFSFNNLIGLTISGPLRGGFFPTITAAGSITLAGNVSGDSVSLTANGGAITQTAGTLTAGSLLTGSATTGAQFGVGGSAYVGALSFSVADGTLTLVNSQPLTVGTLSAPYFQIDAPGQITLAGGTIQTAGLPLSQQSGLSASAPGSGFAVSAVGTGSGSALFSQTGVTLITYLPDTETATQVRPTVRIDVAGNGGISLNELYAPSANLVLASPAGALTGALAANNLLILGYTGSANLSGTVLGRSGQQAAAAAQIGQVNPNYLLNGCVIAVASCGNPIINNTGGGGTGGGNGNGNIGGGGNPTPSNQITVASTPTATLLLPGPSTVDLSDALSNAVPQLAAKAAGATQTLLFGLVFPPNLPGDQNPEIVLPNVSGRDY
jgi:hypothetical protein